MSVQMADRLRELHHRDELLVLPNPHDVGTARLCESLGFAALATTSAGLAWTLGRPDATRAVGGDEAIAHARQIVAAAGLPVTGDLEDGFAPDPAGVALTVTAAREAGLAGCCIEDATYDPAEPVIEIGLATERIAAASEAAHRDGHPFVLTARAENFMYGWRGLDETIARLRAYSEAGADALYAPALIELSDIERVVDSVDKPVNVLVGLPGQDWSLDDLQEVGVSRVSVGPAMSRAAFGAVLGVARALLDERRLEPVAGDLPDPDALFSGAHHSGVGAIE